MPTSTVAGRFTIALCSGVGCHTSNTASQTSFAKSSSVAVKVSGLYCSVKCVSVAASAKRLIVRAAFTASVFTPSRSRPNTILRNSGAVALYRCTIARFAPRSESNVRSIRSSRACVSTSIVTSSGMWPPSISSRTKLKSVSDADGNATSISLKPIATSVLNIRILRAASIGSNSAWLPSRRSVLIQIGAFVIVRDGHVRSGRLTGVNGRYFVAGFFSIMMFGPRSVGLETAVRWPSIGWQARAQR